MVDSECICEGNWRDIVNDTEHLINKLFRDHNGDEYRFFGIVWGSDDFYYGMRNPKNRKMVLLSCVGNIEEGHGYVLQEESDEQT